MKFYQAKRNSSNDMIGVNEMQFSINGEHAASDNGSILYVEQMDIIEKDGRCSS